MAILNRSKENEEREFYVRLAIQEKWSSRELERQLWAARFERTVLPPPKLSTVLRELRPQAAEFFDDIDSLQFLGPQRFAPVSVNNLRLIPTVSVCQARTIVYESRTMSALADLFPNTRAEILRLLFGDDRKEAHLRDLARHASLSPAAVQRELSALATLGLIIPRRDGNRLYFRANTDHPLYPEIRGIVLKTSGIAPTLQNALASVAGVDLAFIFGSMASGNLRSSSDVDLLVIGTTGLRKITAALSGISGSLGREINPHCLTPAEWNDKLQRQDAFVLRVSAEPKLWLKGGPDALAAMGS